MQVIAKSKCPHGHAFDVIDSPDWKAWGSKSFTCPECGWVTTLTKDLCQRLPDGRLSYALMPDEETAAEIMREHGRQWARRHNDAFFEAFLGAGAGK